MCSMLECTGKSETRSDWVGAVQQNLKKPTATRITRLSNPAEGLNLARALVGSTTIFVGGTTQTTGRSLSIVSEAKLPDDSLRLCPLTLMTAYAPDGQILEQVVQLIQRAFAGLRDTFIQQGLTDESGEPVVDVVISQRDHRFMQSR